MYVWQMNDGRWHVSNFTSIKYDARMCEFDRGYETEKEAYAALNAWLRKYPDAVQSAYK